MKNKDEKPKRKLISTKTKIITALVLIFLLFIFAMYLGMRFQVFLTRLVFNSYFLMAKAFFWGTIVLILILACYVYYLVYKHKKQKRK